MLLSDDWVCGGVTHEYWCKGREAVLCDSLQVAWINYIGDDGAKADQIEQNKKQNNCWQVSNKNNCERYSTCSMWPRRSGADRIEEVWYSHVMNACDPLSIEK